MKPAGIPLRTLTVITATTASVLVALAVARQAQAQATPGGSTYELRGRVTDADTGGAVPGAIVQVRAADSPDRTLAEARSRADGAFSVGGLALGKQYTVTASQQDPYRPSVLEVDARTAFPDDLSIRMTSRTRDAVSSPFPEGRPRRTSWDIRGQVLDTQGQPIAGAHVRVLCLGTGKSDTGFFLSKGNEVERGSALADGKGEFAIDIPLRKEEVGAAGAWYLMASASGFASVSRSSSPDLNVFYRMVLRHGGTVVVGSTLESRTGRAIPHALVLLHTAQTAGREPSAQKASVEDEGTLVVTVSDERGRYRAPAVDERAAVVMYMASSAEHPAADGTFRKTPGAPSHRQDIHLTGGGTLRGSIRDSRTDDPVARCLVLAHQSEGGGWSQRAYTDAQGSYIIRGVPLDVSLGMAFEAKGYVKRRAGPHDGGAGEDRIVVASSKRTLRFDKRLDRGAVLRGRVVDSRSAPIKDAVMRAASAADPSYVEHTASSDGQGSFEIEELQPDIPWTLEVRHKDFAPAWLEDVQAQTEQAVEVVMKTGGALSGRVTYDSRERGAPAVMVYVHRIEHEGLLGDPAAGPGVRATPEFVERPADRDGTFFFDHLNEGRYRVEIREPERMPWEPLASRVTEGRVYDRGTVTSLPDVVLTSRGSITGRVRVENSDGIPLTGRLALRLRPAGSGGTWHEVWFDQPSGESDELRLSEITPGEYDATVYVDPLGSSETQRIRVDSSGNATAVFEVHERQRLEGVVRDQSGRPVPGALVDVFDVAQQGDYAHSLLRSYENASGNHTNTQADGSFRLTGLVDGEYRVVVLHPSFALTTRHIHVRSQRESLEVALSPGASMVVSLLGAGGRAAPGVPVVVTLEDTLPLSFKEVTDAQGQARFHQLPEGEYHVSALSETFTDTSSGEKRPVSTRAAVSAGEERQVLLKQPLGIEASEGGLQ